MRRFAAFVLLILCFISCVGGGTKAGKPDNAGEMPVPEVSLDDPAIVPVDRSVKWWVTRHDNRKNSVLYDQKIILIGDSITQGYEGTEAWAALNSQFNYRITNLGFSGDRTEHVIWRLLNGEFPAGINPEYVVLLIGTNNKDKPESIAAGIGKIIKIINENAPNSKILLFSLLPCGSGSDDENAKKNYEVNRIISKYNGYLNIQYVDIWKYYLKDTEELNEKLFSDKLHLTLEGYNIWKSKIIEIITGKQEGAGKR